MLSRIVVLVAVLGVGFGCKTDVECNMAGVCSDAVCVCDAGFTGDTCAKLALGLAYDCGDGGLCWDDESTWGGHAVKGDDGKYHVYAALFRGNCPLGDWLSTSVAVHAVGLSPTGPFVRADIALAPRNGTDAWDNATIHNPFIQRAADGTYLLYYMGANGQYGGPCTPSTVSLSGNAITQRIGLAISKSPYGPWTRVSDKAPLMEPPATGWDSLFQTNPSAYVFQNGSVLLVYKGRDKQNTGEMSTGTAWADHWSGPYQRRTTGPIENISGACEDAGVYFSPTMNVFRAILHCGCTGLVVWSTDGVEWRNTAPEQPWCSIPTTSNATIELSRRERPQVVMDAATGHPAFLWTSAMPAGHGLHDGRSFTLVAEFAS